MIVLRGARERVEALQFSPDGRTLIAPCSGGVQLWDHLTDDGLPAAVLDYVAVCSARFTPDGRKLLLGGSRRAVLHDLPTGEAAEVPLGPWPWEEYGDDYGDEVYCDLTPDGRHLVAAHQVNPAAGDRASRVFCPPVADPAASTWSVRTPRLVYSPPLFLAGGDRFVLFEWRYEAPWGRQGVGVTRDARTGEVVSQVPAADDEFHSPVLSPDRGLIAARGRDWVAVFQADDLGAEPVTFRNDNGKWFTGLAFHPSGRYLAATTDDATVKLYDTTTWAVAEAYTWGIGRLRSVAFSPDGMLAAAGGDTGKVVVWDVDL